MKNTMYLDTSGKKCIVGIVDKKGKSYSVIEEVLKKAKIAFSDIERIIICTGPRFFYRDQNRNSTFKRIMFWKKYRDYRDDKPWKYIWDRFRKRYE